MFKWSIKRGKSGFAKVAIGAYWESKFQSDSQCKGWEGALKEESWAKANWDQELKELHFGARSPG